MEKKHNFQNELLIIKNQVDRLKKKIDNQKEKIAFNKQQRELFRDVEWGRATVKKAVKTHFDVERLDTRCCYSIITIFLLQKHFTEDQNILHLKQKFCIACPFNIQVMNIFIMDSIVEC
jgi:hypothetical protein